MTRVRLPARAALGLLAVAVSGVGALAITVPSERTLSVVFEADGQTETATRYLVEWGRRHPEEYFARLHTADLQLLSVHPEQALRTLEEMAVEWPRDKTVLMRLVDVEDSLLLVDETRVHLERLAQVAPNDPATLRRLADLYRWKGLTEPLLATLRALVRLTDDADERAELIDVLLAGKRYADLIAWLKPEVEHAPNAIDLRLALYEAHLRTGEVEKAAAQLKEVLKLQPERVELLRPVAENLIARGMFDQAVALYRERIDRQPRDAHRFQAELNDLYETHAEELVHEGKLTDAQALYRDRIARAPNDVALRLELSELYGKRAAEVAIQELKQLLHHAPDSFEGWVALAERYSWREQLKDAIASYRQAHRLKPNDRAVHRALAQHILWNNQSDDAIAEYRLLAASDLVDREALVEVLVDEDRASEAVVEVAKLPPSPRQRYLDALVAHAVGDDQRALPMLVEWTKSGGGDERAWQAIFECATALDDPELAVQALKQVQKLKAKSAKEQDQ